MTAASDHASDTDNRPADDVDLAADHAEGTGSTPLAADEGTTATTRPGWLPTMAIEPASGARWALWAGVAAGIAVLIVAGGMLATRLPGGTTLAGIPVAAAEDAPAALATAQTGLAELRVAFTTAAGTRVEVTGAELGLDVDERMSTAPVGDGLPALRAWLTRLPQGPTAHPVEIRPLAPATLADIAGRASADPVDADVRVERVGVDVIPGEDGLTVGAADVAAGLDAALTAIATAPPQNWPATLEVPVDGTPEPPAVTQADIDAVAGTIERVEQADVVISAEVDVPAGLDEDTAARLDPDEDGRMTTTVELTPQELRTLVDVEPAPDAPAGQRLRIVPNAEAPPSRLVALLASAEIPPRMTATVEDVSPAPRPGDDLTDVSTISGTVVPGATTDPGFQPDREATLAAVIDAALAGRGDVDVIGGPFATPSPADMGIVEPVSTFTTFFPAGQSRVQNIQRIAEIVDGTIIPAGEHYELNHAVGRRTADNGFVQGGAIIDGELVSDIGGGVSQFATTFFNAAWFAGVDLVDWKAHSIYFSRYPAGREATINYPNVNLEIRNDTPYAILVDTSTTATSVTVTFWSTPYWDVQTVSGPCACGGSFRITVDRIRTAPQGEPIQESWTTIYTVERPGGG